MERAAMKPSLIVPMPEVSHVRPYLDRTTLIVELDIDRAIAGGAFAPNAPQSAQIVETMPLPVQPYAYSWQSVN
jgi:hypothetical protein